MRKSASIGVKTGLLLEKIKKNKPIELSLPKFTFRNTSINVYLVYTFLVFSFLLGMLTNEVLFLQSALKSVQSTATQTAANAAAVPSAAPTPPQYVNVS